MYLFPHLCVLSMHACTWVVCASRRSSPSTFDMMVRISLRVCMHAMKHLWDAVLYAEVLCAFFWLSLTLVCVHVDDVWMHTRRSSSSTFGMLVRISLRVCMHARKQNGAALSLVGVMCALYVLISTLVCISMHACTWVVCASRRSSPSMFDMMVRISLRVDMHAMKHLWDAVLYVEVLCVSFWLSLTLVCVHVDDVWMHTRRSSSSTFGMLVRIILRTNSLWQDLTHATHAHVLLHTDIFAYTHMADQAEVHASEQDDMEQSGLHALLASICFLLQACMWGVALLSFTCACCMYACACWIYVYTVYTHLWVFRCMQMMPVCIHAVALQARLAFFCEFLYALTCMLWSISETQCRMSRCCVPFFDLV